MRIYVSLELDKIGKCRSREVIWEESDKGMLTTGFSFLSYHYFMYSLIPLVT